MKDTRNLIFHLLLSCADNFSLFRHEHVFHETLAHEKERVSVKKKRTTRARVMDSAVTDHPGQRYGFKSLKFAKMEFRTVKEEYYCGRSNDFRPFPTVNFELFKHVSDVILFKY